MAALTPPEIEITIVNEAVETIDFDRTYDLVGITGFPSQIGRAREIANEFKKRIYERTSLILKISGIRSSRFQSPQHLPSCNAGSIYWLLNTRLAIPKATHGATQLLLLTAN